MYEEIRLVDGSEKVNHFSYTDVLWHNNFVQLDDFENIAIGSGKRKNRTNDSKIVRAPKGKKKKKTNDEGIR